MILPEWLQVVLAIAAYFFGIGCAYSIAYRRLAPDCRICGTGRETHSDHGFGAFMVACFWLPVLPIIAGKSIGDRTNVKERRAQRVTDKEQEELRAARHRVELERIALQEAEITEQRLRKLGHESIDRHVR